MSRPYKFTAHEIKHIFTDIYNRPSFMSSLLINYHTLLFGYNCPSLYPCPYITKARYFEFLPQKCGSRIKFATAELTRRRNETCLQQSWKESADRKRLNVCHTNGFMSIIYFVSVLP